MSRLIVKNLPAYLDEGRLQAHFGARYPAITDVKIVRRPDGTSRRFGFVGFKSQIDADSALQYFQKTYIDTARIDVGVAKAVSDVDLKQEAEKRKRRKDGVVEASNGTHGQKKSIDPENKSAPRVSAKEGKRNGSKSISFDEFLQVMAPRSKRKSWKNEEDDIDGDARLKQVYSSQEDTDAARNSKRQKHTDQNEGTEAKEGPDQEEENEQDQAANDDAMTDLEYMRLRMKKGVEGDHEDAKEFEQSDDDAEDSPKDNETESRGGQTTEDAAQKYRQERERRTLEAKARKDQEDVDTIMESARLFVRNLPFEATEEEVESYFAQYGAVAQAHITLDKHTKESRGIAFVSFHEPTHALAAFRAADGSTFQGRLLHVLPAVAQHAPQKDAQTLKGARKQDLKAKSGKDFNWSTLYMSSDAVASSIASRLNINKADLLTEQDEEAKTISPAVRLALAETSIIQETKEYLEAEGVNLSAFDESSRSVKRSDSVILVKNIPFGTSQETLRSLFAKHGSVSRVVVPPSGTIAVVEMDLPGEAKVAFKALAYKRLGNSLLYLEKAPLGVMNGQRRDLKDAESRNAVLTAQRAQSAQNAKADSTATRNPSDISTTASTLFVKNLSFSTTDERLVMAFGKLNGFLFARIQKRTTRRRDGKGEAQISMGYGFVGFANEAASVAAQKVMDKTTLDGHVLSVNLARRGHDADDGTSGQDASDAAVGEMDLARLAPSTKLIVKNLAFQASRNDVRALFAAHGKLKSVRVPRKGLASGGGTAAGVRGFAFVEFVSRREALNAYRALRHSHLLGRHLVLEWDTEGSTVGPSSLDGSSGAGASEQAVKKLREKAARGIAASSLAASGGSANRRDKLRLGAEDIRSAARNEERRRKEASDNDEDDDDESE